MIRALLAAAVLVAGAGTAPEREPSTLDLLAGSVKETPEGNRARATLVNQASRRAEEIIRALSEGDDDQRVAAAWVLRACSHPQAIPALVRALRDENFSVARTAAMTLKEKKAADGPLAQMLSDDDPAMRWRAAANIGHVPAPGAAAALAKAATSDPADYVRLEAAEALKVAPSVATAEALVECFFDPVARVRDHAATSFDSVFARVRKDPAAEDRVVQALLDVLEKHRDKPQAVGLATERLSSVLLERLGQDAVKWRRALATQPSKEGAK